MESGERKLSRDEELMCTMLGFSLDLQTPDGVPVLPDSELKGGTFAETIRDRMNGRIQLISEQAIDEFLDEICKGGRRPIVEARRAAIRALLVKHLGSHEDNS